MRKCCRRIRCPVGTALTWAVAGALVGVLMEWINDAVPGGLAPASLVDVWPPAPAIVGFLGGAVYSAALGLARGRRIQ